MRIISTHAIRPGLVSMIDPAILVRLSATWIGPSDCPGMHPFLCLWKVRSGVWAWTALTSSDSRSGWSAMRNCIAIPPEHRLGKSNRFQLSPCYVHDYTTHWVAKGSTWVEASQPDRRTHELSITDEMLGLILAKMRRAA